MATRADVNLKGISDNKKFAETNDPNYRFVNFFNLRESNAYTIGAINDTKNINFTTSMAIPGNQTAESCRLNAASLYNQINTIDYSSSSNYKKGFLERTAVAGRMDQEGLINVDFFLDELAEITDYDLKMMTPVEKTDETTSVYPMSIELFGYIVVPVSGNYSLNIKPEFLNSIDIVVAWLKNNAETSYRTTNTTFNTKETQNTPIYLAKGVFSPIRIQMIVTGPIGAFPFIITDGTNTVTEFYSIQSDKKRKQVIFSLTRNLDKTQSCNIYTEGNVENYGIDKAMWETGKETRNVEIKELKRWPLDPAADSVGLDETGNLVAFSNNVIVGAPLIASNYSAINKNATSSVYQMILRENIADIIRLVRINRFLNKPDTTTTSSSRTSGSVTGLLSNRGWNNYNRNILNNLDRITESDPLVSTNKRIMLVLVRDKNSASMSLVLYASTSSATTFYGLNVDNKLGKPFYANKNVAKEYLREVPSVLTAYSSTSIYASYGNYYPQTDGPYKTGSTKDCRQECNTDPTCTHTYNVTDAEGVKCLLSSGQPVYSIKPADSPYTASTLHVRGKALDINQMKDKSFQNVKSEMGSVTGFNNYTLRLPLTKDSIAFTKGEDEFILLQNKISASTSEKIPLVRRDPNNKPAGIIQGFSGLFSSNLEGFQYRPATTSGKTVVQNISGQLIGLQGQIVDYTGLQTRVGNLARDISENTVNINSQYTTLSGNNAKYDFSGDSVNVLDEDYGITPALLKDNAIYLEEQTNLNIIGTITLATLLISAIFVSR
jgi:hypothetical protein